MHSTIENHLCENEIDLYLMEDTLKGTIDSCELYFCTSYINDVTNSFYCLNNNRLTGDILPQRAIYYHKECLINLYPSLIMFSYCEWAQHISSLHTKQDLKITSTTAKRYYYNNYTDIDIYSPSFSRLKT